MNYSFKNALSDKQLILEIYVSLNVKMNKSDKTILVTGSGTGIGQVWRENLLN